MSVSVRTLTAAAVLTAAVAVSVAVRRYRRVCRELERERAAGRLTAGCLHRDLDAFQRRLEEAVAQRAVVDAAVGVLEDALAHQSQIDPEGGLR